MRIGLMIGPEKGRYPKKVERLVADAEAAEQAGFHSIWVPQLPGDFDALTAIALMGRATDRIELGTAVLPIQTRHPVAMAQQALSNQAVCEGRFTLGLGPSHHWIVEDMLGLPYDRPARQVRDYLEVLNAAFAGPGPGRRRERRLPRAQPARRHRHRPDARAARRTRTRHASHRRRARLGDDPLDGRRAGDRRARPAAHHQGGGRGRAARPDGSWPASRSRCAPTTRSTRRAAWANQVLGHAEYSPNYQRLLEHGDATDVGDVLAAGDESAVVDRLRSFRDAGVTDLAVRVLPLGEDRAARIESRERVTRFLASLCPEL